MEEYIDILDDKGIPQNRKKLRTEVHKDGDYHAAVHIWIINDKEEILLQRRCATKDMDPNMLDISCAGHLTSGDDSITCAIRELKEELNLDVKESDLKFIKRIKHCTQIADFIDNEINDIYLLKTKKTIEEMNYQREEISEIFFVPYLKFKEMISNREKDLVIYEEEYSIILPIIEKEFNL